MRRRTTGRGLALLLIARVAVLVAQGGPDLSGTWKLDAERSRITASAGLAGLIGAGVPATLHITQPANGTVVVESQINEGHSRIYVPGARSTTPAGQAGTITMTTRWEGRTLVGEGKQESAAGTTTAVKDVREELALSADGGTLSITVTAVEGGTTTTSALVYSRIQDVGPCQSWPTPCKKFPQ